jgi:hypothetical protein
VAQQPPQITSDRVPLANADEKQEPAKADTLQHLVTARSIDQSIERPLAIEENSNEICRR